MGKVNLRITLEMHAEGESYINPNTAEELKEALEGMLSEVIGDERMEDTAACEKKAEILESLYNDLKKL